ncbi:MAG: Crp/Fnr family transcriptional regulator [Desulfobacterales bacterium]|jgi:CRP/FNR family transcriptional regulator, dissimilatory nitrate respiration regulator|nr:Crp/Fnr family transcriptional regulator [Desulfobacteraceae bacterium]MBT4363718.1 Crp/Fnr family transcriptional regulator [Desulfobacteraceae bacterium]MBT7086465.1 Crp/Fnr family transcriptional regulator [Desulfobacterales bacterium]MBT7696192.1 Crp/Fnr family transcriptional regulator [Desulfobacterales bacterium]
MNKRTDIISAAPIFEGLPEEQLHELRKIAVEKEYGRGRSIFIEGDKGNGFYIVAEGSVKIFKVSMEGKEQILHIFGPGEPFGEVPVFTGKMFPANAEAISKSSLLFFPRDDFINLISRNPSLALNMLGVLSMRLRQFTVQVENLSLKEVPGRLAGYLRLLSKEQDNNVQVVLNISKNQLASLLGTIPETMSRIFTKMSERGLIEVEGRMIKLIDNEGLDDLAEQGKL